LDEAVEEAEVDLEANQPTLVKKVDEIPLEPEDAEDLLN
jgi:hypothetical protein